MSESGNIKLSANYNDMDHAMTVQLCHIVSIASHSARSICFRTGQEKPESAGLASKLDVWEKTRVGNIYTGKPSEYHQRRWASGL